MREKLFELSLVSLIISAVSFIINYFFFHFVTDSGITFTWHPEAGKPFVTDLIGIFGALWLFAAAFSLVVAIIFTEKETEKEDDKK